MYNMTENSFSGNALHYYILNNANLMHYLKQKLKNIMLLLIQ